MKKTVFVLGAGASKEVGLPVGAELKRNISDSLNIRFENGYNQSGGDYEITQALRLLVERGTPPSRDINPYLREAHKIREGMPLAISIDNFIDVHSGNELLETCGKFAIISNILNAEDRSKLQVDRTRGQHPTAGHTLENFAVDRRAAGGLHPDDGLPQPAGH